MHVQNKGNTLSFDMECGDAKQILIAVSMTMTFLSSRHFTGTIKSNVAYVGKTAASAKQLDAKWRGAACKKE
jgi:nitrogen fixation protein FixH